MFGIGVPELMLILVLALIVLGPDKLPQVAKQIAKFVGDLKRASEDFKKQLDVEGLEDIRELKEMANLKNPQTWKKNFDRLVDIDREAGDAGTPAEGAEPGVDKSDLPGGLGPEWKVAPGRGRAKDDGEGADKKTPDGSEAPDRDVINPDIDMSALDKATGATARGDDESQTTDFSAQKK